jgi:hypothetical protein
MTNPSVCAVMLTADRPEMARRAVECFRSQTYDPGNRWLIIYDTGDPQWFMDAESRWRDPDHGCIIYSNKQGNRSLSIGQLRNEANGYHQADIAIHFDDDDWSHPSRIADQVGLLQSSDCEVAGYSDLVFWQTAEEAQNAAIRRKNITYSVGADGKRRAFYEPPSAKYLMDLEGAAWIYNSTTRRTAAGTTLCYWRYTWEQKPFPDLPRQGNATGEDVEWLQGINLMTGSSIAGEQPMMIATIHGHNTSGQYANINDSTSWRRAPQYDSYCRWKLSPSRAEEVPHV